MIFAESFEHSWLMHNIQPRSTSTSTPESFTDVWAVIQAETTECGYAAMFSDVKWPARNNVLLGPSTLGRPQSFFGSNGPSGLGLVLR